MEFEAIDVETFKFDVVRKGYDRLQVEDFLQKISTSMARLEERRKLAEVRSERAARELEDLRGRADATIQETVASRARMIAASPEDPTDPMGETATGLTAGQATIEAQNIIEQATSHATSIHAEAEAVLASAMSTSAKIHTDRNQVLGSVDAERAALIATAGEEADAIRAAALEDAERAREEANARADEIRRLARADASALVDDARQQSAEIAAAADRQRDQILARAEGSGASVGDPPSEAETPIPEPAHPFAAPDRSDDLDEIAVDLREDANESELEPAIRRQRASRYKSRSANLPSLGNDAGSVIGSLESLRSKEPEDE